VICLSKKKLIKKLLLKASVLCFILCIVLIVWFFVSGINILEEKYWQYIDLLTNIEHRIAAIKNKWLIVFVIELLYFILTAFPVFPVSILCVASAMVFNFSQSLVINICGLAILFSVRYSTGKREGGGSAQWLVRRSKIIRDLVEDEGQGNPWLLAVIRLLPFMPINPVSHLYGAMDFPFNRFILISVAGFLPKLISYIIIGNNFTNIFSPQFTLPLIILTFISGIFFLLLRGVWNVINKVKER